MSTYAQPKVNGKSVKNDARESTKSLLYSAEQQEIRKFRLSLNFVKNILFYRIDWIYGGYTKMKNSDDYTENPIQSPTLRKK